MATEGDPLATELADADPNRRLEAIARLIGEPTPLLSDPALRALVQCLGAESKAVRRRAADALARAAHHDGRVLADVRNALKSTDRRARWGAAYALGSILGTALGMQAAEPLLESLADEDSDVRWAAAELVVRLGAHHPQEIREALLALAERGTPQARRMALYCLRDLHFSGADVLAQVKRASHAEHAHLRLAALSVLGHLGDSSGPAASIATRCLESDPDHGVRRAAAIALGHVGDASEPVAAALRRAAADETDNSLRRAAHAALKRLAIS